MRFIPAALRKKHYNVINTPDAWSVPAAEVDAVYAGGDIPVAEPLGRPGGTRVAILFSVYEKDYGIAQRFIKVLAELGCQIFPIVFQNVREQLERCRPQGIILPGGAFTVPDMFRENPPKRDSPPLPPDDKIFARFNAYRTMIDYAKKNALPTLGICAGMQMLAILAGGGKIDAVPAASGTAHSGRRVKHEIEITPGTMLREIIKRAKIKVNSLHKAHIGESPDYVVSARAPDGTIEAIEFPDPWSDFVLGAQWHPERLAPTIKSQRAIFEAFLKSAESK
jgi:putative glutamine amidotransferase